MAGRTVAVLLVGAAVAVTLAADEPGDGKRVSPARPVEGTNPALPAASPAEGSRPSVQPQWLTPDAQHGGETTRPVKVAPPPRRFGAEAVSRYRALATADGEARVLVAGAEHVVRPGSVLGTDVVRSVAPGRLVVLRPARAEAGGEALVIVTFDAQGNGREQVVWTKDPTASPPREVEPR